MKRLRVVISVLVLLGLLAPALPVGAGRVPPFPLTPLPPLPPPTSWEGGEGVLPSFDFAQEAAGERGEGLLAAATRGNPWINLRDGEAVSTTYEGVVGLVQALDTAQPRALSSDDFDADGMPDLIAGYATASGGLVALHRGSVDYLWPDGPEADARRAAGLFVDAPFLPAARLFALPIAPDFLGAGDFDNDPAGRQVHGGATWVTVVGDGWLAISSSWMLPRSSTPCEATRCASAPTAGIRGLPPATFPGRCAP